MTEYRFHYAHQAVDEFVHRLNAEISARVKSLIEDKHLYQSVTIDADIIKSGILEGVMRDHVRSIAEELTAVQNNPLVFTSGSGALLASRGEANRPLLLG
jgi:hypothetical protein